MFKFIMFGSGIKKKRGLSSDFLKASSNSHPFLLPASPPCYSSPTISLYHLPKSRICAAMVTAVSRDRLQWPVFPHMLKTDHPKLPGVHHCFSQGPDSAQSITYFYSNAYTCSGCRKDFFLLCSFLCGILEYEYASHHRNCLAFNML